jgi:hypothetical protein
MDAFLLNNCDYTLLLIFMCRYLHQQWDKKTNATKKRTGEDAQVSYRINLIILLLCMMRRSDIK